MEFIINLVQTLGAFFLAMVILYLGFILFDMATIGVEKTLIRLRTYFSKRYRVEYKEREGKWQGYSIQFALTKGEAKAHFLKHAGSGFQVMSVRREK